MDSAQSSLNDVPLQDTLPIVPKPAITADCLEDQSTSLAAYKRHSTTITLTSPHKVNKARQLKQQKYWVVIHSIIWLAISACSIPVLDKKQQLMTNFYGQPECCYCLWTGLNINQYNQRIEWSPCTKYDNAEPIAKDLSKICNINDRQYCTEDHLNLNRYLPYPNSQTQEKFNTFPIIFYGVIAVGMILIYITLIGITTFHYKLPLDERLFIGNVVCTIICYYPYIKCYQFSKYTNKDSNGNIETCPNMPLLITNDNYGVCYRSTTEWWENWIMDGMWIYLALYILYCLFRIWPCICVCLWRCCRKFEKCRIIVNKLEIALLTGVKLFQLCISSV